MKHKAHFCLGCVSLLCLLVALDSVNVVMAVSEDPAGRNTPPQSSVSVSTSTELYQGLANPSVSEVVVEQDIYLGMWPDFDRLVIQRPVVVVGRHLKNVWPVLDVSPATGKLELAPNSSITFKGLTLAGWSPAVGHGFLLVSASPAGGSVLVEVSTHS